MGLLSAFGFGGSSSNANYNQNSTTKPILDPRWTGAFDNASGNVGTSGYNPSQQQGVDYFSNQLNNPFYKNTFYNNNANTNNYQHAVTDQYSGDQSGLSGEFAQVNMNGLAPIFNNAAPQANLDLSTGAPLINAQSGASQATPYSQLYGSQVTDPALQAYDYGTDRALSALDARTAAGGGFANSRSGLAYSDLAAQSALGRGQLSSQLNQQGLTSAFGFGQQDASRGLSASTTNAGNIQNNSQFNAAAANQSSQFNVNAQQANTGQKLQAAQQWSDNVSKRLGVSNDILAAKMGMSQQNLTNAIASIMGPEGIDQNAAMQLVNSGQISFQQLATLVSLAQAANGSQQNITGNSNTSSFKIGGTI